jgi:sulfide:quinone oxidoreductase
MSDPPPNDRAAGSGSHADPRRPRVLIAGGGVAALETLLALRDRAAERLELCVLAPAKEFVYRPLGVLEPFETDPPAGVRWRSTR